MSITITLDAPRDRVYESGDIVSGKVNLLSNQDISIGHVSITFTGYAEVEIVRSRSNGSGGSSTSRYRSRCHYFYVPVKLYTGIYTHRAGHFSWPFAFEFPHEISRESWNGKAPKETVMEEKSPWRHHGKTDNAPHPLPSSCDLSGKNRVRYCLTASYMPHEKSSLFDKGLSLDVDLFYTSHDLQPEKREQILAPKLYKTAPDFYSFGVIQPDLVRERSFKDRFVSHFSTSATPHVRLCLESHFPAALPRNFSGTVPWTIKILRVPAYQGAKCPYDESTFECDRVQLKNIEVKLYRHEFTRAEGHKDTTKVCVGWHNIPRGPVVDVDHSQFSESEKTPPALEAFNLGTCLGKDFMSRTGVVESFSTYNIAVTWTISVKMHICLADKEEKWVMLRYPV